MVAHSLGGDRPVATCPLTRDKGAKSRARNVAEHALHHAARPSWDTERARGSGVSLVDALYDFPVPDGSVAPFFVPRQRGVLPGRCGGVIARGRLVVAVLLTGVATASVAAPPEGLLAERRDAHVRDLTTCGRKKACLMRQRADAVRPDSAAVALPTVGRSRWSESQYDNVTVWIGPGEATRGWRPRDRFMVRDAFHAWTAAGAPVRFVFVPDSSRADIRVLWRDSLPEGRAGQATRFVDRHGWLRAATVEMGLGAPDGRAPRPSMVRAIALHEVGHLLGLEHSANEHDLMAAWVTARAITPRDQLAMRALYHVADPESGITGDASREAGRARGTVAGVGGVNSARTAR